MQHAAAINQPTWLGVALSPAAGGGAAGRRLTAAAASATRLGGMVNDGGCGGRSAGSTAARMVAENALIVFGRRGCCMCHVVKLLLQGLGVNPTVHEVEEDEEAAVSRELATVADAASDHAGGDPPQLPAVFVGGKLLGGMDRVMATHISGELVPMLKAAGALWL